jgi:hypothetical protein
MNAAERAAELRAEADNLETVAGLEATAESATKTYRKTKSAKNKAEYREAVEALRSARATARPTGAAVTTGEGA